MLLSKVYEQKQAVGDDEAQAITMSICPVAWQHVNLFGNFEFSPSMSKINIDALVASYADPAYWSKALREEGEPLLS
ncbi:MAG: hypothetical protein JJD98_13015 [Polaromonas sp.]|nr:hypothetical protein [Polaromonas sp.]